MKKAFYNVDNNGNPFLWLPMDNRFVKNFLYYSYRNWVTGIAVYGIQEGYYRITFDHINVNLLKDIVSGLNNS